MLQVRAAGLPSQQYQLPGMLLARVLFAWLRRSLDAPRRLNRLLDDKSICRELVVPKIKPSEQGLPDGPKSVPYASQPASLCLFAYDGTPGNWNDATLVDETDLESNGTVTDVGS